MKFDKDTIIDIKENSEVFHSIMMKNRHQFEFYNFKAYPNDCCEFVSRLLIRYLLEKRIIRKNMIKLVRAITKFESGYHVWVQVFNRYSLDLTVSQFFPKNDMPIFKKKSKFHDSLEVCDFLEIDNYDYPRIIQSDYEKIVKLINVYKGNKQG